MGIVKTFISMRCAVYWNGSLFQAHRQHLLQELHGQQQPAKSSPPVNISTSKLCLLQAEKFTLFHSRSSQILLSTILKCFTFSGQASTWSPAPTQLGQLCQGAGLRVCRQVGLQVVLRLNPRHQTSEESMLLCYCKKDMISEPRSSLRKC